jgi:hypothetical protein
MSDLPLGDLQQVGAGAPRTMWSFDTTAALVDVLEPSFLGRRYAHSVIEGDLVAFSCGSTVDGNRVHGLAVVVLALPGAGESSGDGRVILELLCTNSRSRAPAKLKVAS